MVPFPALIRKATDLAEKKDRRFRNEEGHNEGQDGDCRSEHRDLVPPEAEPERVDGQAARAP